MFGGSWRGRLESGLGSLKSFTWVWESWGKFHWVCESGGRGAGGKGVGPSFSPSTVSAQRDFNV